MPNTTILKRITIVVCLIALLVYSCSTKTYVEPDFKDAPTLTIQNKWNSPLKFRIFEAPNNCSKQYKLIYVGAQQEKVIKLWPNQEKAHALIKESFDAGFELTYCRIFFSFTAKPGHDYIVDYDLFTNHCELYYYHLANGKEAEPDVVFRDRIRPFFSSGGHCKRIENTGNAKWIKPNINAWFDTY